MTNTSPHSGEAAALTLQALDRMIESCEEDMGKQEIGNYGSIGFLSGELKGLKAAHTYLKAAIERYAHSATEDRRVVYQCPRCATSMEVDPTAKPSTLADKPQGEASEIEEALWALHAYEAIRDDELRRYSEADITRMVQSVRSLPSATGTMVYWSERDDRGEWQHYRATPEEAGKVLTARLAGEPAPLAPHNIVATPSTRNEK